MGDIFMEGEPPQTIKETIRNLWNRLSENEINALCEARDIFFMAVRKKHGVARAQAELILRNLLQEMNLAA